MHRSPRASVGTSVGFFCTHLSLRQLCFSLTEICYELRYGIDTGDNLTLSESESDVEIDSFSVRVIPFQYLTTKTRDR